MEPSHFSPSSLSPSPQESLSPMRIEMFKWQMLMVNVMDSCAFFSSSGVWNATCSTLFIAQAMESDRCCLFWIFKYSKWLEYLLYYYHLGHVRLCVAMLLQLQNYDINSCLRGWLLGKIKQYTCEFVIQLLTSSLQMTAITVLKGQNG